MVAEVLCPKDFFVDRIQVPSTSFHRRRKRDGNKGNTNTKSSSPWKSAPRLDKKVDNFKFEAENSKKSPIRKDDTNKPPIRKDDTNKRSNHGLIMGQVTILKRGETLNSKVKSGSEIKSDEVDFIVSRTERMEPDTDLCSKNVKIGDLRSVLSPLASSPQDHKRNDTYAGYAVISPSPKSLPMPSFFSKKQVSKIVEDSATEELCRLLRLE